MTDASYAATHRSCINERCGKTGYVLPVGDDRVIPILPDESPCAAEGREHTWGPYAPAPEMTVRASNPYGRLIPF